MSRIHEALERARRERELSAVAQNESSSPSSEEMEMEPLPPQEEQAFQNPRTIPWRLSSQSVPTFEDQTAIVEQFRRLRSRIAQARFDAPVKTILVSSALPAEGKSFIALNLAMSFSRSRVAKVLLIDCDLRRPSLHRVLGTTGSPGLTDYFLGTAELEEVTQRREGSRDGNSNRAFNLTFIPAGRPVENASELVAGEGLANLLKSASPYFDWILIDSPPVLTVSDAVDMARTTDAVLLVAREGRTPCDAAQRVQAALAGSRILGYVLNDTRKARRGDAGYYYYYYSTPSGQAREKTT